MTDLFYIFPTEETKAAWSANGQNYCIDTGIDFESGNGLVSLDDQRVFIFTSMCSLEANYVGKVFDFKGNCLFEIPFPKIKTAGDLKFWGVNKIGKNLRITFSPETGRDFWCMFDLEKKCYFDSHETR